MTSSNFPKRGEVYWTPLDPAYGSEMQKTRPCLIVTSDNVNRRRRTVVIVPLSTTSPKDFPLYVSLPSISAKSQAVTDQIRVIDKERLGDWIATVSANDMEQVADAIKIVFDLR